MKQILITLLFIAFFTSCSNSSTNDTVISESEIEKTKLAQNINKFIWRGLNNYYVWKDEIPNLENRKVNDPVEFGKFLRSNLDHKKFFESLLYRYGDIDQFSYITDNYTELEKTLSGSSDSSGLHFVLTRISNSDNVIGIVTYIDKNSNASSKDISRGDVFNRVNNVALTTSNYGNLLFESNSFTLGMAEISNNAVSSIDKNVALSKSPFNQDPILKEKIINLNGKKIGYLMYNAFYNSYDKQLNEVFGRFKSAGVNDLILDLRYNSGGAVISAIALSSMITGQFSDNVFLKIQYNNFFQSQFEKNNPSRLFMNFTKTLFNSDETPINSLNLNKVYILGLRSTASASELVINCLKPYINVVHIGANTRGKYTGSITIYDSPTFTKDNISQDHKYAMQPLILKLANANGVSEYSNGLTPNIMITENYSNLGVLGDASEPLLKKAIDLISGKDEMSNEILIKHLNLEYIEDSNSLKNMMYLNSIP